MGERTIALNRRARHEYTIDETFEAGLVLTGTEIKSVRGGKVNLSDAFARVEHGVGRPGGGRGGGAWSFRGAGFAQGWRGEGNPPAPGAWGCWGGRGAPRPPIAPSSSRRHAPMPTRAT